MKQKETRSLRDLYSVGPATVRDLKLLGITRVEQLVGQDAGSSTIAWAAVRTALRPLHDGRFLGSDCSGAGPRPAEREAQVVVLEPGPEIRQEMKRGLHSTHFRKSPAETTSA